MNLEGLSPTPKQRNFIKTLLAKEGSLTSEALVKAAESQDSPIHDLFVWDNRRAGHLYRLRQAARILRSYTGWLPSVVTGSSRTPSVAYQTPLAVKVRPTPEEPARWVKTANALEDEFMRSQLAQDRMNAVKRFIKQLLTVPELVALYEKLNRTIENYRIEPPRTPSKKVRKEFAHVR